MSPMRKGTLGIGENHTEEEAIPIKDIRKGKRLQKKLTRSRNSARGKVRGGRGNARQPPTSGVEGNKGEDANPKDNWCGRETARNAVGSPRNTVIQVIYRTGERMKSLAREKTGVGAGEQELGKRHFFFPSLVKERTPVRHLSLYPQNKRKKSASNNQK